MKLFAFIVLRWMEFFRTIDFQRNLASHVQSPKIQDVEAGKAHGKTYYRKRSAFRLACVAGGFYGWLTRKPGTRVKTSNEAAGKWGEGNEKPRGEAAR